jgi:hypothetical protein
MKRNEPPQLDMTLEGEFVAPPTAPVSARIMMWAVVVAIITGGLAVAAIALWLAMMILPVALGAALVAYLLFRYRMWRAGVGGRRPVNLWTPPRR